MNCTQSAWVPGSMSEVEIRNEIHLPPVERGVQFHWRHEVYSATAFSMMTSSSGTSSMETFATGFDGLDFVDHIGAGHYFSEDCVAPTLHAGGGVVHKNPLSATLMKNWAVAECGSPVRAIATV